MSGESIPKPDSSDHRFSENLRQRGVDIAMDLKEMPDGKVVFIRDNAGILIELVEH
ncbi:VOC family protein [Planctomycetota bacterium]